MEVEIPNNDEEREKEKKNFQEKLDNVIDEMKYVKKSNNFYIKNIKNADDRIKTLNENLETLRTQKYILKDRHK